MFEIIFYLCIGLTEIPCTAELASAKQAGRDLARSEQECRIEALEHEDWIRSQMTPADNERLSFGHECRFVQPGVFK